MSEATTTIEYADFEMLIYKVVSKFQRLYGGDFDEMVCEANDIFLRVSKEFDPDKGKFSNLLWTSIWRRLLDLMYHNKRRRTTSLNTPSKSGKGELGDSIEYEGGRKFFLDEFIEGMSNDAVMVIKLVLNTPSDLASVAEAKGNQPRNWRSSIRNYLFDIGWSSNRISKSFEEVTVALNR